MAHPRVGLQGGLTHRWMKPGTSVINPDERPPKLPPDRLIRRWPHEGHPALIKHPIPMPSPREMSLMEAEAQKLGHQTPLDHSPVAREWVRRVIQWFQDLTDEVQADQHDVHLRFRACVSQWNIICSHLPKDLAQRIKHIINRGYSIKWLAGVLPEELRHDCKKNPPMMKTRLDETWKAFDKMLRLGTMKPYDATAGLPPIVCPVFFVDENGKLRVVHNLKWLNRNCDPSHFAVWLETMERMRGMFPLLGWLSTTDFSNAYFHVPLEEDQHHYITFALTAEEMPEDAVRMLRRKFPHCERDGRFFFSFRSINFGFAPSAQIFCLFSQACQHVWARCPSLGGQNGISSYIDDWALAQQLFAAAVYLTLNVLAGMAVLGWMVNLAKTRILPRRSLVHLSIVVDLNKYQFSLTSKRVAKIMRKMLWIRKELKERSGKVCCKTVASFVGSIYSTSIVLKDKVALWSRNLIRELARQMRIRVKDFTLSALLRHFWRGSVAWTKPMESELRFWESFDFLGAKALISHDFMRERIEDQVRNPTGELADDVTMIAQDASKIASGMQRMQLKSGRWVTVVGSMVYFSHVESESSSTLREVLGSLRAVKTFFKRGITKILLPCDSYNTYLAIRRGSRNDEIHAVAIEIFFFCLEHGVEIIPVWTERSHYIIKEADKRGRFVEPNDYRTPPLVVHEANRVATQLWGGPLQFDRAASAFNALPGMKFNSLWPQVGSAGVDMFKQSDWAQYINFVHVSFTVLPRLLAFLPSTKARVAVLVPLIHARQWTPSTLPGAPGVVHRLVYAPGSSPLLAHRSKHPTETFNGQYAVVFFDFTTAALQH